MKQLFTCLPFLFVFATVHAQTISWGMPVTVTTGSGSNLHPRIALNRNGDPYILWGKTDTRAYFSKWNGSGFTTPSVPSGSLTVFSQSWAGPDLAVFGDTVYVTMKVTPEMPATSYTYLAHSYNGGATFSMPMRMDNIGNNVSRFPIVTTTANGNPLIAFMKFDSGSMANARYVVAGSNDYGMTFSPDVLASRPTNPVCDCCPAALVSTGNKAIMLFRDNAANLRDIWAGISNDGGQTFTSQRPVDTTNWMINSCPASGPDGFVMGDSLYSVFMSTASGTALVYLSRTAISGSATSHARITGKFTGLSSQNYPRIANAGNAAIAVWKQNTTAGNGVAYSFTNDISAGFSSYNTVAGATGSGIMNADVAMMPGAVHIVWQDDNSGKVMYVKGTYTVPTSINSVSNKEHIRIYPNPATEQFTVAFNNGHITQSYLIDQAGRNIELKPAVRNGMATFSLQGISSGNYIFIMSDDAGHSYYNKLFVK